MTNARAPYTQVVAWRTGRGLITRVVQCLSQLATMSG